MSEPTKHDPLIDIEARLKEAEAALQAAIEGSSPGLIRTMARYNDRIMVNATALLPAVEWLAQHGSTRSDTALPHEDG